MTFSPPRFLFFTLLAALAPWHVLTIPAHAGVTSVMLRSFAASWRYPVELESAVIFDLLHIYDSRCNSVSFAKLGQARFTQAGLKLKKNPRVYRSQASLQFIACELLRFDINFWSSIFKNKFVNYLWMIKLNRSKAKFVERNRQAHTSLARAANRRIMNNAAHRPRVRQSMFTCKLLTDCARVV